MVQKLISQPKSITEEKWQDIAQVLLNWNEETSTTAYALPAQCFALGKDYQQALIYWEKAGYPEQIIDKKDLQRYYLVKAKLTPLPQALEYLAKAEKYLPIVNLWLNYGKSQDSSWLKYVAIAYEATNHFEQAFIVYCHLDELAKVEQCWEQIASSSHNQKYLKQILSYYLDKQHWQQAIFLAKKYFRVNHLPYFFLYSLGQSQLLPNNLTKSERQSYQKFIQQNILHNSRWQEYFIPQYLGTVLEKIGSFLDIFTFYEQYIDSSNLKLRQFSRHRWLATKRQQVTYFQDTNQIAKVKKAQQELTKFAKKWQINLETVSLSIPAIKLEKPQKQPQNQINKAAWQIKGLPSQIILKTIAQGVYQFQLHHLIVRLIPTTKQIAIADTLSHKIIRFDGRLSKLQIDTTTITLSKSQSLSLQDTLGNYSLTLIQENSLCWELALNDYSEKITIELRNL